MSNTNMLYLEPKDDETYAIMKYIEKYVEHFNRYVEYGTIISNSRSMFPRLVHTNKRGQIAFKEMNNLLFSEITA